MESREKWHNSLDIDVINGDVYDSSGKVKRCKNQDIYIH